MYSSTDTFCDWRNKILLIIYDIDDVIKYGELQNDLKKLENSICKNKPICNINKIYVGAFEQESTVGGERYSDVNTTITNAMEKGTLVFCYFGHGEKMHWVKRNL